MFDNPNQISFSHPAPGPEITPESGQGRPSCDIAIRAKGGLSRCAARSATAFVMANIERTIKIDDIAADCGLSPGHFARAFKQTMGRSPHRWLIERRVARAKELLLMSDLAIVEIASDCGFADQSHLTRHFADVAGLPPAMWRRLHRV